jgi:hypothetical protein
MQPRETGRRLYDQFPSRLLAKPASEPLTVPDDGPENFGVLVPDGQWMVQQMPQRRGALGALRSV